MGGRPGRAVGWTHARGSRVWAHELGRRMRTRPRASCSRRSPRPQGKAWARRRGRYLRRQGSRGQSPSQAASESKHGAAWSAEKGGQPVFSTRVPFVRLRDLEKRLDCWRMRARGGLGGLGSAPCSGGAAVPPCPLGARRRPPRRGSALAGSRFVSSSLLTPSAGGHAGGSGTLGPSPSAHWRVPCLGAGACAPSVFGCGRGCGGGCERACATLCRGSRGGVPVEFY